MEKILIIDDENDLANLIADIVTDAGYKPIIALNEEDAYKSLKKYVIDLTLLDVRLTSGGQEGLSILQYCRENLPSMPVIMMSGHASLDAAVEAVKHGAVDFVEKPFSRQRLILSIQRELANAEQRRVQARLNKFDYDTNLVAQSAEMSDLISRLKKIAPQSSRMLVIGERGTGKNAMAYYLHTISSKKTSRYYEFDCGRVGNKTELINVLVGVNNANNGLLFDAMDGTLVLDKIEYASAEVQTTLLNLLNQLQNNVSFKIISLATPKIYQMVEAGLFKQDLFMKLAHNMVEMPLLKNRLDDFVPLIQRFALPYSPEIPAELLNILQGHTWPGNLHELKNVIQQMLLKNQYVLDVKNLIWKVCDMEDPSMLLLNYRDAVQLFTQRYFEAQLNRADGNQTIAAEKAGVDRSTLYRKTEKSKKKNT